MQRPISGIWPDWLIWEHLAGHALVWLAYIAAPVLIWWLGGRRVDWSPFQKLYRAFACFMGLCALGQFVEMLAFFRPMDRLAGHLLVLTGFVSWWAVWSLRCTWPAVLALRSPAELERMVVERTEELSRTVDALTRADIARAHLAAIVESSDNAIIGKDLDGVITSWNAGAERLLGYAAEEAVGRPITFLIPPDRAGEEPAILARLKAGERVDHFESVRVVKGGGTIDVSLTISPIKDRQGRIIGFSKIARDITDQKRAEEELRRARDEAMAATRAKGNFLANMSHEIRTPMNGVMGMTELLLDTPLNDLQRDYAVTIRGSAEDLLTVINDILDFSKIEAGKLSLESVDFDLGMLMEQVADLLGPRVHQKRLEINSRVDPKVPARLSGDPVRIRQLLTNLAGNAVKFTDRGEINLEASLVSEDDERATVKISVRDTGIGIAADRQAEIFESFTQIEEGNRRKYGGTGLGLSICRHLIDLMGGTIGLESVPGRGSTFWFELALGKAAGEADVPAADLGGLRVLVVDDHESNRSIAREALLSWNCRPEVVGSGAEAFARIVATFDNEPYGVVLLDQEMPGNDGLETARMIKAAPRLASVPLLLLASIDSSGASPEEGLFFAKLSRPLRRMQLHKALCAAVAVSGSDRAHSPAEGAGGDALSLDLRILLVEDNDVNRRVAIGLVERLGCRVDAFENGWEALEALDHDRHELILMDVQMPEMDGLAATAAIRAREQDTGQHIPILAMTAHAMTGDREKCLAAGMDGYLSKPLRPGPLREALAHWAVTDRLPIVAVETAPPPPVERSWTAESLRESCRDDTDLISEVVGLMLKGTPARLDRLAAAIAAKDARQVSWEAHALKGAFQTVGAEALASSCQELIALGELGDFPSIESIHAGVLNEWDQLKEEVGGYLLRSASFRPH